MMREENMKPMLFNTGMVRALLDGRKTVTRRVVKPQPVSIQGKRIELQDGLKFSWLWNEGAKNEYTKSPYRPGDILYVREAFQQNYDGSFSYRAGHKFEKSGGWRPSIHMPREAARIFLRVTGVRVERLKDMTADSAMDEGFTDWNDLVKCWNSTIKPADLARYGWDANPWVWVIEFERISKEKT